MARDRSRFRAFERSIGAFGEVVEKRRLEVSDYVSRFYGFEKSFGGCPGETDCRDFKKAAGNNREEKESNACTACPKFKSKPKYKNGEIVESDVMSRLLWIQQQRDSGFGIDENKISYLDYQCLLVLDREIVKAEHRLKISNFELAKQNALMLRAALRISG